MLNNEEVEIEKNIIVVFFLFRGVSVTLKNISPNLREGRIEYPEKRLKYKRKWLCI